MAAGTVQIPWGKAASFSAIPAATFREQLTGVAAPEEAHPALLIPAANDRDAPHTSRATRGRGLCSVRDYQLRGHASRDLYRDPDRGRGRGRDRQWQPWLRSTTEMPR